MGRNVLIAHTKIAPTSKWYGKEDPKSSHIVASQNVSGNFTGQNLKELLDEHGLKLRSSHPDALKNLHANLMKVKHPQSHDYRDESEDGAFKVGDTIKIKTTSDGFSKEFVGKTGKIIKTSVNYGDNADADKWCVVKLDDGMETEIPKCDVEKVVSESVSSEHAAKDGISVERNDHNGSFLISTITDDGRRVKQVYYGYSKKDAIQQFREYLKKIVDESVSSEHADAEPKNESVDWFNVALKSAEAKTKLLL